MRNGFQWEAVGSSLPLDAVDMHWWFYLSGLPISAAFALVAMVAMRAAWIAGEKPASVRASWPSRAGRHRAPWRTVVREWMARRADRDWETIVPAGPEIAFRIITPGGDRAVPWADHCPPEVQPGPGPRLESLVRFVQRKRVGVPACDPQVTRRGSLYWRDAGYSDVGSHEFLAATATTRQIRPVEHATLAGDGLAATLRWPGKGTRGIALYAPSRRS